MVTTHDTMCVKTLPHQPINTHASYAINPSYSDSPHAMSSCMSHHLNKHSQCCMLVVHVQSARTPTRYHARALNTQHTTLQNGGTSPPRIPLSQPQPRPNPRFASPWLFSKAQQASNLIIRVEVGVQCERAVNLDPLQVFCLLLVCLPEGCEGHSQDLVLAYEMVDDLEQQLQLRLHGISALDDTPVDQR